MAIDVKVLGRDDLDVLMNVAPDVFDHPVDPAFAREFLEDPRHHIAVALEGGKVIGFVSAVHYVHPDKGPEMWINEVSVASIHRRRGLGRRMLQAVFDVGRAHNCAAAWVLTDRLNISAMRLYVSAGGREGADDEGPSDALLGYSFDL